MGKETVVYGDGWGRGDLDTSCGDRGADGNQSSGDSRGWV